jgi:hypothetical protein
MYVVEDDGFSVAGSFCKADISRNYGFEDLGPEEASQIGRYLLREGCTVIVHGEQNPFDC